MTPPRPHTLASTVGLMVLLAMHYDSWRGERTQPWFGWLPGEPAYRFLWLALCIACLTHVCRFVALARPLLRQRESIPATRRALGDGA